MKPVQNLTRILDHGGDTLYAAGFDGVWLTLTLDPTGAPCSDVCMHSPTPILECEGEYELAEFIAHGEPDHDCRLLPGCCWMVQYLNARLSAEAIPNEGRPGEPVFDAAVLRVLSDEVRNIDIERPTWRARVARLVRKWALR